MCCFQTNDIKEVVIDFGRDVRKMLRKFSCEK